MRRNVEVEIRGLGEHTLSVRAGDEGRVWLRTGMEDGDGEVSVPVEEIVDALGYVHGDYVGSRKDDKA